MIVLWLILIFFIKFLVNREHITATIKYVIMTMTSNYLVEFLNSLTISGLPPHKLVLKINCIVLLIRNLNTKEALVNGTWMRIKFMHRNVINCEVLTRTVRNKRILIPRINLTYSGTILPFNLQRTQSPIIPALGMTVSLKDKHFKKLEYF